MNKLDLLRLKIDEADNKIIRLLKRRFKLVNQIGLWKKQNKMPVLDKKRWEKVLESKIKLGQKLGLNEILIKKIYDLIHKEALEIENRL